MSEERSQFARQIDEHTFTQSRRGYDKTEVKSYLQDLEQAFRELEGHSRRQAQKLVELEREVSKARATEKVSVDNAMLAVFDAKDRILERARRKADEIEDDANLEAGRIREAALKEAGGGEGAAVGEIAAARAQADEIVASARREADRLRDEVAAPTNEELEAELADMGSRLRRAHDETADARTELESARNRIVELENAPTPEDDGLKDKFAELEHLASESRDDAKRLAGELEAERAELETARSAASSAERALRDLQARADAMDIDLDAARTKFAETEALRQQAEAEREDLAAELVASSAEVDRLRAADTAAADDRRLLEETERVRQELEAKLVDAEAGRVDVSAKLYEAEQTRRELVEELASAEDEKSDDADQLVATAGSPTPEETQEPSSGSVDVADHVAFASRMASFQTHIAGSQRRTDTLELLAETQRIARSAAVDTDSGGADGTVDAADEAQRILDDARAEAEEIAAEAEERADKRAAKVIAKAREEADQVRQTVATLTAQAEDARSAALRSKIEADDLVQAQRSMGDARDDIVHAAEDRAAEIRADAERAAAAMRKEAGEELRRAHEEADRVTAATVELAPTSDKSGPAQGPIETAGDAMVEVEPAPEAPPEASAEPIAETEERGVADHATSDDGEEVDRPVEPTADDGDDQPEPAGDGDDLAALLAAAEKDLAASDELRKQREELDEREAELAAQQAEAALLLASSRDTVSHAADPAATAEPIEEEAPLTATSGPTEPYSFDIAVEESAALPDAKDDDDEDPAERLSALLEEVAPVTAETDHEPLDLDEPSPDLFATAIEAATGTPTGDPLTELATKERSAEAETEDEAEARDTTEAEAEDTEEQRDVVAGSAGEPEPALDADVEPGDPERPRMAWPAAVSFDENGDNDDDDEDSDRQSRYRSRSAKLPRLGDQAQSNVSAMANLRRKGRGKR